MEFTTQRQKFKMLKTGFESIVSSIKKVGEKSGRKIKVNEIDIKPSDPVKQEFQLVQKGLETIADALSQVVIAEKGDKGDSPLKEEIIELIKPLIPLPIKGQDGKDGANYILTEDDISKIANSIKVPIVEKVIEKTEVIKELPSITEIIKEVAVTDDPERIVAKLQTVKRPWLSIDAIDGDFNTKIIRQFGGGNGTRRFEDMIDVDFSSVSKVNGQYVFGGSSSSTPQNVSLSYTGDNLTNVLLEDGTSFNLGHSGSVLSTVTDGTYTWSLNYTGDKLTSVTV